MKALLASSAAVALLAAFAAASQAPPAPPAAPDASEAQPESVDVRPAMAAAEAWLGAIDAGRYGDSWEAAAPIFRGAIAREDWVKTLATTRAPLGLAISRKLRTATYARRLPGAAEGEYVVIQYDTRFEARPLTEETVTPMRLPDGSWRVAGYYVR